ncbi:MAG TPA: hypothetical protein VGZ29_16390 [Terriglobia bacterium]|nr:hypothetical protein [Terriglobia bacterium]
MALILGTILTARPAHARQVSAKAPAGVQIDIPSDVPVRIVNFAFDRAGQGMTAFHYDVQNTSGQGLVAVEIRWQGQFSDPSGSQGGSVVVNRDDRWLTGQLAAGASEHFQVTNVATTRDFRLSDSHTPQVTVVQHTPAESMSQLVGSVAYVELEDGSRLGSDAARVGQEIDKGRRAQLASAAQLLHVFGSGGNEALAHAVQQGSAAGTEDAATQELNARLLGLLQEQGADAVVLELQRISALTAPESRD